MSITSKRPPSKPVETVRLLASDDRKGLTEDTDYELSASLVGVASVPHSQDSSGVTASPRRRATLDPEATTLFQHRLVLCCLVASLPFAFFLACAATNFIELFGRNTVGWVGLVLCAVTWIALLATAAVLNRRVTMTLQALRTMEVAIFGTLALFFSYWSFQVLTAYPLGDYSDPKAQRIAVIAAALVVHFNWFALIVFHGVLVPNTLARGAGVALALGIGSLVIDMIAALLHPPTGENAGALFAIAVTMLAVGSGLSVFGTAKTEALRKQVESARETIRQLGQYRLRRKLGQGGMGEVFLAEHQLLKRPCALKRIHSKFLDNTEQVRRFEREVQATAQLRHPNTVEIYDYGRGDDGTFYYVMEYLAGPSLEDIVTKFGPLPPERVIHILQQVCSALKEAHRHGLVHRDIKPSNIVVIPNGIAHDQTKILDFGLVHSLVWINGGAEEKITREGLIVGTPEYMSPEQASGGTLDERSDLFSVGSMAYFLLTGREAFHRENSMKTLLAVVNDQPKPITSYNPIAPTDLMAIVAKCLAKLPGSRYAKAADVELALAECKDCGQWNAARAEEWWAAHGNLDPDTGTDLDALPLRG